MAKKNGRNFKDKSNEELIAQVAERFKGFGITELEDVDGSLMNVLRKRKILEQLVSQGIIVRKSNPAGFYENMSDEELVNYGLTHYKGEIIYHLEKKHKGAGSGCGFMKVVRTRGLVDLLIEKGVLAKKVDNKIRYKHMSDAQFVQILINNHKGKSLTQIFENEKSAYREIMRRKLDSSLMESGIITHNEKTRKGTYSDMTDTEMISYISEHYSGFLLSQFAKAESRLVDLARKRKIIPKLLEQKILVRHRIYSFSRLTDSEILEAVKDYKGMPLNHFRRKKNKLYHEIEARGLLPSLLQAGNFVESPEKRNIQSLSNQQLIDYVKDKYYGNSLGELGNRDYTIAAKIRERGLTDNLVSLGILTRIRKNYRGEKSQVESLLEEYTNA